jgi:hypothetical protein
MPPRRSTKGKKAAAAAVPATPATAAKSKKSKNVVAATPLALDVNKKGGDQAAADAAVPVQKPVNFFGKSMPRPCVQGSDGKFPEGYVFANEASMRESRWGLKYCVMPPPRSARAAPPARRRCTCLDAVPAANRLHADRCLARPIAPQ